MPGLRQRWPEGAFYRFDDIYSAERLAYHGPQFGWWSIPDQFSLARLDELELARQPRAPVFAFFPTISTHTPFSPTPPYQPDWRRMLSDHPYDTDDWERSFDEPPDWLNLGPSYAGALSYDYEVLAGFVQAQADRDIVLIVVGDHQPPAAVSGKGASWDVPVHVIASRQRLLERLRAHGFRDGLTPRRPTLARMNALLPILLDAFGSRVRTE